MDDPISRDRGPGNFHKAVRLIRQSASKTMEGMDEILFPRRCPVCLNIVMPRGGLICEACRHKLLPIGESRCMKCGKPIKRELDEYCTDCKVKKRHFVTGIAGFSYESVPVRRLISRVKYHNERQLLDYPCLVMAERFHKLAESFGLSCLIPVPLHPSRRRKRGFNQADEIAKRLGGTWDIPVAYKLLYRVKKTVPQKELDEAEREKNLAGAFEMRPDERGIPLRAGLVDDIYTTGSTMEACTLALLAAGVEEVYSIVLAAVP